MKNFFADIGPNLGANIPDSVLGIGHSFNGDRPKLGLYEVEIDEAKKLLLAIPDCKSTGPDGVPIRFLIMAPDLSARLIFHKSQCTYSYTACRLEDGLSHISILRRCH